LFLGFKGRYAFGGSGDLQASIRRAREKIDRSRGPSRLPEVQSGSEIHLTRKRDGLGRALAYVAAVACVVALLSFGALHFVLTSGASRIQTSSASTR
jgi:type VI protein secretion system component VasF